MGVAEPSIAEQLDPSAAVFRSDPALTWELADDAKQVPKAMAVPRLTPSFSRTSSRTSA